MNPIRLVINADDLGLSDEVDAGIFESINCGVVTSATLLVNPPFTADISRFLNTGASIGLHFNLTLGKPCSAGSIAPSLVDADGRFFTDIEALLARLSEPEAEQELRIQFELFRKIVRRNPCQLSFHKHLHAKDQRLLKIVAALGKEMNIPVRSLNEEMANFFRSRQVMTNDHFLGDVKPSPYWTLPRFKQQLGDLQPGLTELMCHPGKKMKPMPGIWYCSERDTELATLIAPEARAAVSHCELLNFWKAFPETKT
ncbi:MAG: ChbG/HpnK family deacetylase [Candidatus Riflebacteria bacterium]|nr:ChbG/HpnK family deacetylase [Candidatus Riflebacteria bacterium]